MVLIHLSDVKQGVAPALHQDFMRTRRQEKTFHPILPKRYSCHSRFQPQTLKQWLTKILKNVKHAFWKCINKNNVKTCDFKMWKITVKNVLKKSGKCGVKKSGKKTLWKCIVKKVKNVFLVGAGTSGLSRRLERMCLHFGHATCKHWSGENCIQYRGTYYLYLRILPFSQTKCLGSGLKLWQL